YGHPRDLHSFPTRRSSDLEIEFRDVSFDYDKDSRAVLRGISLSVPAGKMVALVGESGGGKSTLTKLLPRFHDPNAGAVLWDGVRSEEHTSELQSPCNLVCR